jgi:hypothetical protein
LLSGSAWWVLQGRKSLDQERMESQRGRGGGRGRSRGRWGRWGRGGGHERRMGGEEEEEELPSLIAAIFNGNIITELTVFPKW